jgi:hypothetical protein
LAKPHPNGKKTPSDDRRFKMRGSRMAWAKKVTPYFQNNWSKRGWRLGSSGGVLT